MDSRIERFNPVQILLVAIALMGAAVLAHFLAPHELMAKTTASLDLETMIPKHFGKWTLVPDMSPVSPQDPEGYVETASSKIYSQEVGRTYTDGRGSIVMLMVAYGPVQNFRLKAHRPEMCYTAAGFRVSSKTNINLTLGADLKPIKIARLIAERESRYEPISYWMRVGHDITTGVIDRQIIRLKYGLRGLIPDGALVRVSTIGLPREASYALQDEFIRDLLGAIAPRNRWFFTGA
jgi:EpsI family protein